MAAREGQQFGNYRLLRLLGQGGFSEVYLGEHQYLKSHAALKLLRISLHDKDREQFLHEAQTLVALSHPNIVRVLDFAIEQEQAVLVMEYAPGGTMRHRNPRGSRLPLDITVAYLKQIAAALQYAHDHSVIHRDVKPENILLDENQHLLLSDFGLALFTPSSEQLSTRDMAGTMTYMAPEQLQGHPTFASDQYALGIMTYEWLCGKRPFSGGHFELMRAHLYMEPPLFHEEVPTISLDVEAIVLKALAKDPQKRFASVQQFANALEQASQLTPSASFANIINQISPPESQAPQTAEDNRSIEEAPTHDLPLPGEWHNPSITSASASIVQIISTRPTPDPGIVWSRKIVSYVHKLSLKVASPFISFVIHIHRQFQQAIIHVVRQEQSAARTIQVSPQATIPDSSTVLFPHSYVPGDDLKHFFILYHRTDRIWAEWIAWQLEEAGYTAILPAWDFRLGSNFDREVQKATAKAKHIIAVLSPDYLNARSPQSQWTTIFRRDILVKQDLLLPIYVRECGEELRKPLETITHIDLIDKDELQARDILLAGISFTRSKPTVPPTFPGKKISRALTEQPPFPAHAPAPAIDPNTLLIQQMNMMTHIVDALSKKDSPPIGTSTILTQQVLPQIQAAFLRQDWLDVIRKADYLIKREPITIPQELYRMQWQALLKEGEMMRARETLDIALALINDNDQRLSLLKECAHTLTLLDQWNEIQRYINEALRFAPNDPYWLILQQQTLDHVTQNEHMREKDSPETHDNNVTIQASPKFLKQDHLPEQQTLIMPSQTMSKNLEMFFAYARKDEVLRNELEIHLSLLKRQGLITGWHDRAIPAGKAWESEIDKHLNTAHIILLLVSAYFLDSDYCYGIEMEKALERHKTQSACVIPIILRPVEWKYTPFGHLQALPRNAKPVTEWPNREKAFFDIARGIRQVVEEQRIKI